MPGPLDIARIPLRLAGRLAGGALTIARAAAGEVLGRLTGREDEVAARDVRAEPAPPAPVSAAEAVAAEDRVAAAGVADVAPAPSDEGHVDVEAVLVGEFAERGAEQGAGPEVEVAPPWDGYDAMTAADIAQRLRREGDPTVAAAVELYETRHKGRRQVLSAAGRVVSRAG